MKVGFEFILWFGPEVLSKHWKRLLLHSTMYLPMQAKLFVDIKRIKAFCQC